MRRVSLGRAQPGIRVARTIFTLDGIILVPAGVQLTRELIHNLEHYGITEIYIDDKISEDITYVETIKEEILTDIKSQVKKIMTSPSIRMSVAGKKIENIVNKLLESILQKDNVIISLSDIRSVDDYTFSHSVNVSIFSLITGITLGYKGEDLKGLGEGALLHDIGKVLVSEDVLKKPSTLTAAEYEEVKRHTVYGYDILRNSGNISPICPIIALYHHERIDGSGYPYKLKDGDIPVSARIVAVSDVYDALTTNRVYRKKIPSFEVLDYMCSLADRHFDKKVLKAFICHIANYPVGTAVLLNSGEKGLISKYNPALPNKPIVKIVMDRNGKMLGQYKEVDLSRELRYSIAGLWNV